MAVSVPPQSSRRLLKEGVFERGEAVKIGDFGYIPFREDGAGLKIEPDGEDGEIKINLAMMVWSAVRAVKISSPINGKILALAFIAAAHLLGFAAAGEESAEHAIGSGPEDWWIGYPDQHPDAGSSVDHPSWALDPLEEKPVIMLIHSSVCSGCITQEDEIEKVLEDLGDDATYLDVLYESDPEKTWTSLEVYDPGGDPGLIPMTVVLTIAPGNDGEAEVAWHSAVGWTGEVWVRSYLSDAVALYAESSEGWLR